MKNDKRHIKEKIFPNAQLMPAIVKLLDEGHSVTLPLHGYSMRPFLEDGRDKALLVRARFLKVGAPVLAEVGHGNYVLHRIVRITGDDVVLRGDGNLNTEHCKLSDVKGEAIGFYRKGRNSLDKTCGMKWRLYSFFGWRCSPPGAICWLLTGDFLWINRFFCFYKLFLTIMLLISPLVCNANL